MRNRILAVGFLIAGILTACQDTGSASQPDETSITEAAESNGESKIDEDEYKRACQTFDYKEYFRNDQEHIHEKIQVDITIDQMIKGDCRGYDASGNEYYVSDMRDGDDKVRLMEDDYVTVYGEYAGVGEITRAIGDYEDDIFCINAKYIVLHKEDDVFGLEASTETEDGIPVSYLFPSDMNEEASWHSDSTGYYLIPYMEGEVPTILFTGENSTFNYSIVYYADMTSIQPTSNGGLVCTGDMYLNSKEETVLNGTIEITWDSWETIDFPSVRMIDGNQTTDMSMIADDYCYFGPVGIGESEDSEYIFPDSDSRLLTPSDMAGLSAEELRIAKNEIYARHGRMFTSEDLKAYFESKSWYQGYVAAEQFNENVFNQIEKDNIVFIQKYIDNPSGAAGDSDYASRGLAINDPQAIPQIPGVYNYYSNPSDKNSLSMELHIEGGYAYVSFNEDGHQYQRSIDLYNMNDQEYVDDTGNIGIYFDDYGKIATYNDSGDGFLSGSYTYLP